MSQMFQPSGWRTRRLVLASFIAVGGEPLTDRVPEFERRLSGRADWLLGVYSVERRHRRATVPADSARVICSDSCSRSPLEDGDPSEPSQPRVPSGLAS